MSGNQKKAGYTLIELIVTVAIIGILAAIAIPAYTGYRLKSERSVAWSDLQTLRLLEEQFYAENGIYAGPFADTAAIQAGLPAFLPDASAQALYTYAITVDPGSQNFTATAARVAGTGNDPGSPWTITNLNVSNFQ